MHMLVACLFVLLVLPGSLSAQVWTSPTANWGSVTITAKDGASIDQMRVKAVPGSGGTSTIFHILMPHQFTHGEDPQARDYKFDIAYTPDTTNHWKLQPGAAAVQNDIPYTASQQPEEPERRLGQPSDYLGGDMQIARRTFINPWIEGEEGTGVGYEEDGEHTVTFVVFTPGLLIRAHQSAAYISTGEEVGRPQQANRKYATFASLPPETEEGPAPPLDGSATYVKLNVEFIANSAEVDSGKVTLSLPALIRAWDDEENELPQESIVNIGTDGTGEVEIGSPSLVDIVEGGIDIWVQFDPAEMEVADLAETIKLAYELPFGEAAAPVVGRDDVLNLLPVELYSDLNNDGEVNSADSGLVGKAYATGASEDEKHKGTEFMFANDNMSNGAWDKEDTTTPGKPADADDDDAEPIFVGIGSLPDETQVWLEHPGSVGLKYYRDRRCTEEIPLSSDQPHGVGGSVEWPDDNIVFVRAESVSFPDAANPQVEGDLKLMVRLGGAADGIEATKMRLTVVKEFGAKKYFHATQDYILESNTPLFLHSKHYDANLRVLITAMREQDTIMRALDTYHHAPKLYGIDEVTARYPDATVIINGNFTFDRQAIGDGFEMTRRCHGRLISGSELNANTSSDNDDDENPPPNFLGILHPLRGSELAGPNGKHIAMVADGEFAFAKGRVSLAPIPKEALGGLSTNYAVQNAEQFMGFARLNDEERMLFTITYALTTSGINLDVAADARQSGVQTLPGGEAHELELFKFDGGSSLSLSHERPNGTLTTPIKGSKHTGRLLNDYCIHTYLMLKSESPRGDD